MTTSPDQPAQKIRSARDPLAKRRAPRIRAQRLVNSIIGPFHLAPDAVILGAARSGTTSIQERMRQHPGFLACPTREIHFFDVDIQWSLGFGHYRRNFPFIWERAAAIRAGRGPALVGESSPYYLAHPFSPERLQACIPNARLIALLRDPTERAISHWNWRVNRGHESRSFEEAVREELTLLRDLPPGGSPGVLREGEDWEDDDGGIVSRSGVYARVGSTPRVRRWQAYLARGIYLEQVQRWHAVFPREQLLILISERYFADPEASLARLWEHLGLPNVPTQDEKRNARKNKATIDPAVIEEVRTFFRPHNAALEAYLGESLGWR